MVRIKLILAALLAISAAVSSVALGYPIPAADVPEMLSISDYVFVGRIDNDDQSQRPRKISVIRSLKGPATAGAVLEVFTNIRAGSVALFFLRRSGSRLLHADSNYPEFPASESWRIGRSSASDLDAKAALELVNALATPPRELLDTAPRHAYAQDSEDARPHLSVEFPLTSVWEGLSSLRTEAQSEALRELAASSSVPTAKIWAATCLMELDDPSGIAPVADLLRGPPIEDAGSAWSYFATALSGIDDRVVAKDPATVEALMQLAVAPISRVREGALHPLRKARLGSAIPVITRLLWDDDQSVRYQAVQALSHINKDYSHAPAIDRYQANEDLYLGYWRTWASQQGRSPAQP